MKSSDLTQAQAKAIAATLLTSVNYLARLRLRMEDKGFPLDDPMYVSACAAHEALNRLRLQAHYQGCNGGGAPGARGT